MKYCKQCLQPDTRPNTVFTDKGICPACNYFESLKDVDWGQRRREIDKIVKFGKQHNHSGYDCIIGVSGGKDSTRQAIYVRDVLGMNPLLTCLSWPPQQLTDRGAYNISNLISLGFDTITITLSPIVWKRLMRKSFLKHCNWARSTEQALFSSVHRLAIAYQIPLIWWGENPALQLGDMGVLGKDGSDGNRLKHMNTLRGGSIEWMLGDGIQKKDILQYIYPSDKEMAKAGLRVVFLGYYWNSWSLINNGIFSTLRGLDVRREPPEELGDPYGVTALDEDWVGMNQMIKYLKFGFGRTTDYVNEEIRLGRISREEAIDLVERYDGKAGDKYIKSFCDYLEINIDDFWSHLDKFVNKKLFRRVGHGRYKRLFKVGVGV